MIRTDKKAIIFDLDDTLTESKQSIDQEMASLLAQLLDHYIIGIISGASFEQYQVEVLPSLSLAPEQYKKLFLMPTSGAALYEWDKHIWKNIYQESLSPEEIEKIINALEQTVRESGHEVKLTFGNTIEDRGPQVTYSALGQQAPIEIKKVWDPDQAKRKEIVAKLTPLLHGYHIGIGGTTSIDITKSGIDKAYGLEKFSAYVGIPMSEILFVGDALFPGGNDSAVLENGVEVISVKSVSETKKIIQDLLP